ncbi:hypothetical protein DVH05_027642 [Phytophthora capsici]|nr:hypothetical protein DVH05_027642 [Phytophthora capsici]
MGLQDDHEVGVITPKARLFLLSTEIMLTTLYHVRSGEFTSVTAFDCLPPFISVFVISTRYTSWPAAHLVGDRHQVQLLT